MDVYDEAFGICPHCGYDRENQVDHLYYLQPETYLFHKRYWVGEAVSAGGFGIVYRAWDCTFDKLVAIKEYYPGGVAARSPGSNEVLVYSSKRQEEYMVGKERFLSEARKIAKFNNHPYIVDVYDFFEENNTAYMVMEYMDGVTCKELVQSQNGTLDQDTAVMITRSVLEALREVHKEKIIHRDINPNNIFVCYNGKVKLFDFGAARIEETEMSAILTPHYAPPEQYSTRGKQGPYTDIYAVGATLYFMLTGEKPEESTDRVQEDHLIPPHELDPNIPLPLSNTVLRAMALKETVRFKDADEFLSVLSSKGNVLNVEQEIRRRRKKRLIQIVATFGVLGSIGFNLSQTLQEQASSTTLEPTKLSVWVMADENDTIDTATSRFEDMAESFLETYNQVELDVTVMEKEEYEESLNQAAKDGTLPDLFESTYLEPQYQNQLEPLETTYELVGESTNYRFLNQYELLFPDKKQMPLCFQIPVVYASLNQSSKMQEDFTDLEFLTNEDGYSYSVKKDDILLYEEVLGNDCTLNYRGYLDSIHATSERIGYELFQTGEVDYYLSDTSDYQQLTEDMPAQFQVLLPPADVTPARFDHMWSVSARTSDDAKKAAQWIIYYLLSDSAQNILGVRNLEGIPLSKEMSTVFMEVYQNDLAQIESSITNAQIKDSSWWNLSLDYKKDF